MLVCLCPASPEFLSDASRAAFAADVPIVHESRGEFSADALSFESRVEIQAGCKAVFSAMTDLQNKMEDERSGGASLTEAAQKLGLASVTIDAVDRCLQRRGRRNVLKRDISFRARSLSERSNCERRINKLQTCLG